MSVVITTYNAGNSIAKTLKSVLNQDGLGKEFELEIIVIDDCSTDNTLEILRKFDIDLLCINRSNSGGPNKGRNIGLSNATGDYICFLDHDDTWEPQKTQLQLKAATYAPIITCGYEVSNSYTGQYTNRSDHEIAVKNFSHNETFLKKLAKEKRNVQHTYLSTIMISSELRNVRFEENFGMLDYDWILRLFKQRTSAEIPVTLVTRLVGGNNLSLNLDYRRKDYYYSLMTLESFEKEYPRQVSIARKRINGSRARYCYLSGEMVDARKYLLKAMPGSKEILYYITTFFGSQWVKQRFTIFG